MSKIGRRPVILGSVKVDVKGQEVHFTGAHAAGVHHLPNELEATVTDGKLFLVAKENSRDTRQVWGLHRALLSNKIVGSGTLFEKKVQIVGLGYKALAKGNVLEFNLGFSHKIEVGLPKDVVVEIDKTGQLLTFKSANREILGKMCGDLRKLKPTEPYKGTGVRVTTDVVIKKAGKAKSA